ncbi:MAG: dicarboxylate/amino acid:cation symporter [Bdellovibrionales bacterium]|nr:dicarboxylate/amino acid:cation symporter [Bdellovibrionales bacterium]
MKLIKNMTVQVVIAIVFGVLVGEVFGPKLQFLSEIGQVLIQLLKAIAAPMVFVIVLLHVLKTDIAAKEGGAALFLCAVNGLLASGIGLLIVNILRPGDRMHDLFQAAERAELPEGLAQENLGAWKVISGHIPKSIVTPFIENDILGIVILALVIGVAARQILIATNRAALESILEQTFAVIERLLTTLLKIVPLAIFGAVAKSVGEKGLSIFVSLFWYVSAILLGFVLFFALVHVGWILIVRRVPPGRFLRELSPALSAAFASNSSLATLPWTLGTLDRLGISQKASRLSACVTTNFNNDGILLYEVVAALLLAQGLGIELNLTAQLHICFLSILAAVGVAGIPEAGIISLSLVLATVGLPAEYLPLLMTVDWFIARLRSVLNVLSDSVNALVLDKYFQTNGPS